MQNTMPPNMPNIELDNDDLKHSYVNATHVIPSVDECVMDMGISTVQVPPHLADTPMTPEVARQMTVQFKHEYRIYMNWPAAKRFARMLSNMVAAHEQSFGEIPLQEEKRAAAQQPQQGQQQAPSD